MINPSSAATERHGDTATHAREDAAARPRRHALALTVFLSVTLACGRGAVDVVQVPVPAPAADSAAPGSLPAGSQLLALAASLASRDSAAMAADSLADEAALNALDSLDLDSLERRSSLARGTPAVNSSEVAGEASAMFTAPRGGTASAAAPTYDIDVVTFASHTRVQAYVDFFLGPSRERFGIWLGRMARYEGMARNRFRLQGIPEDMVYLGLIESGFSNTAVSRAKAVGMWQFMAGTGKLYGLRIDQWVDERRDPYKATDAAARLLSDLNGEFGSWYLAAAAYNAGSGRVSRGLQRVERNASADSMFFRLSDQRYLKRETRDYVPKLIAAALIAKEPMRYGFDSVPTLTPLAFDEVSIAEQTGLDVIARLSDTTTNAILELNPHYFRAVTPPGRAVIVRVPRGTGALVARRWAELPAAERVTVVDHVIARGETISVIAKRYRVDASLILAANPRIKPRALRVGQRLVIPLGPAARSQAGEPAARARVVAAPRTAAAVGGDGRYHVVRRGESLWQLGQRYGVSVAKLREWNDLVPEDVIKPGARLIVGQPRGGAAEVPAESGR